MISHSTYNKILKSFATLHIGAVKRNHYLIILVNMQCCHDGVKKLVLFVQEWLRLTRASSSAGLIVAQLKAVRRGLKIWRSWIPWFLTASWSSLNLITWSRLDPSLPSSKDTRILQNVFTFAFDNIIEWFCTLRRDAVLVKIWGLQVNRLCFQYNGTKFCYIC